MLLMMLLTVNIRTSTVTKLGVDVLSDRVSDGEWMTEHLACTFGAVGSSWREWYVEGQVQNCRSFVVRRWWFMIDLLKRMCSVFCGFWNLSNGWRAIVQPPSTSITFLASAWERTSQLAPPAFRFERFFNCEDVCVSRPYTLDLSLCAHRARMDYTGLPSLRLLDSPWRHCTEGGRAIWGVSCLEIVGDQKQRLNVRGTYWATPTHVLARQEALLRGIMSSWEERIQLLYPLFCSKKSRSILTVCGEAVKVVIYLGIVLFQLLLSSAMASKLPSCLLWMAVCCLQCLEWHDWQDAFSLGTCFLSISPLWVHFVTVIPMKLRAIAWSSAWFGADRMNPAEHRYVSPDFDSDEMDDYASRSSITWTGGSLHRDLNRVAVLLVRRLFRLCHWQLLLLRSLGRLGWFPKLRRGLFWAPPHCIWDRSPCSLPPQACPSVIVWV